jgi:hypothetical protein
MSRRSCRRQDKKRESFSPGDEQVRDLEQDARLVPQVLERLEHRLEVPAQVPE